MGVFMYFVLDQYNYSDIGHAKLDDVGIDGGAFLGEAALYVAERVGLHGNAYTSGFMSSNVKHIHQNLAMNPQHRALMKIVERPIWSDFTTQLTADDRGTRSFILSQLMILCPINQ